ncbi:Endonuclease/exonuclease/phosphatase [Ceratobasidium sp. AG-I]|nr:Endonuclease/exonuclease/phosphatase [Ceratobasidium sp. AG-I]
MSHQLTPEQIALSLARKKKKEEAAAAAASAPKEAPSTAAKLLANPAASVLKRDWLYGGSGQNDATILVATWNILAQILVRRELFLGSDCLRTTQRHPMILAEILSHKADIFCLQEVDRRDKLLPVFHEAGFTESVGSGPGKKHGCVILHRSARYKKIAERVVFYDEEPVRVQEPDDAEVEILGLTHRTRNVGLLVALQDQINTEAPPVVVATTHLFWHGLYKYERARQVGILRREALRFRTQHGTPHSSIILAGDFNFQPDEAAYALLRGTPLTPDQYIQLDSSRVIHVSLDPSVPRTPRTGKDADDDDEAAGAGAAPRPDLKKGKDGEEEEAEPVVATKIKDSRPAVPADGLLTNEEMVQLFAVGGETRSTYDEILSRCAGSTGEADNVLVARDPAMQGRKGSYEPMWTCFTHYWRSTLDYIFVVNPLQEDALEVVDALKSPRTEVLGNGLPKLGVSASDHVPLAVILGRQQPQP